MKLPKKSQIITAMIAVAIAAPLTWYVFVRLDADPYNLGIASSAKGTIRIMTSNGTLLSSDVISTCSKSAGSSVDLRLSGVSTTLQFQFLNVDSNPTVEKALMSIGGPVNDSLTDCAVDQFFVNRSQRRAPGRTGGMSLSFNYSGDFSMTCKGKFTNNTYELKAQFKNCRY